jgi:hypothetical protein
MTPRCDCPAMAAPHTHEAHGPVAIPGAQPITPSTPATATTAGAALLVSLPVTCRFVEKQATSWDEDGRPQPGDMFYIGFAGGHCSTHEPPCVEHLYVVLPNGHWWDIDGRASNCTLPTDKAHRCWVRHGVPPHITVDKNGLTCSAGAGSILSDGYHGFLREGRLV